MQPNHLYTKYVLLTYDRIPDNPLDGPPSFNNGIGNYLSLYDSRAATSVQTPNFRRKKKSQLPVNPYGLDTNVFEDAPSTMVQQYRDASTNGWINFIYHNMNINANMFSSLHTFDQVPVDDPTSRVINATLGKLSLGKTNALVTLAEANKTAAMVSKTATRIYEAVKAARSGNLPYFTNALGITSSRRQMKRWNKRKQKTDFSKRSQAEAFAAQSWLEYTYGWRPLLNDVYTSAEALATVMVTHSSKIRRVTQGAKNVNRQKWDDFNRNWRLRQEIEVEYSARCSIDYAIDEGAVNPANVFGLMNPLVVAWELVPFSFVADWFAPIGQTLENLTATNGLIFSRGFITYRKKGTFDVNQSPGNDWSPGGSAIWRATSGSFKLHQVQFYFRRVVLNTFPSVPMPAFKNPASFKHAISGLALLSSLWRK